MTSEEDRRYWAKDLRADLQVIQHARKQRQRKSIADISWRTYWAAECQAKESAAISLNAAGGLLGEW